MKYSDERNDFEHDIIGDCPHDIYYVAPTPPEPDGLYIQVNRAGIVLKTPEDFYVSRDDGCRYCLLHCVIKGQGVVKARGCSYSVRRGQMFLLCANEEHTYYSDPRDPMGVVWAEFCGGDCARLVKHIVDAGGCVFGAPLFTDAVDTCTALLYQKQRQGTNISGMLYAMLMNFCSFAENNRAAGISSSRILNYIDENLDHMLTLQEVADVFGYHPTYFSNMFSRQMGIGFSKYVLERKLTRACYLLKTTNWSIERIAHELGFCDLSHFSTRFRKAKAVSPSVYRKNYRNASGDQDTPIG